MNDRLKNFATDPDPKVWEGIQKTMRRRALRRQAWTAVAGVSVVALAVAGVLLWPEGEKVEVQQPSLPDVAQVIATEGATVAEEQQPLSIVETDADQSKSATSESKKEPRMNAAKTVAIIPAAETEMSLPNVQPMTTTQTGVTTVTSITTPDVVQEAAPIIVEPQDKTPVAATPTPVQPQVKASVNNGNDDTVLWVPNIFAPGSDDAEINLFRVRLNHPDDVLTNYRITIFSRSGSQVYMSNDINNAWDGTYRGRKMPQSTYVYVIYYTDKEGLRHQRKGTVTLVR